MEDRREEAEKERLKREQGKMGNLRERPGDHSEDTIPTISDYPRSPARGPRFNDQVTIFLFFLIMEIRYT